MRQESLKALGVWLGTSVLWFVVAFITYDLLAPLHECGHIIGAYLTGSEVVEFNIWDHISGLSSGGDLSGIIISVMGPALTMVFVVLLGITSSGFGWGRLFPCYCLISLYYSFFPQSDYESTACFGELTMCICMLLYVSSFVIILMARRKAHGRGARLLRALLSRKKLDSPKDGGSMEGRRIKEGDQLR